MYNIELAPSALKFLAKLARADKKIADRVVGAIDSLKEDPFAGKKLSGDLSNYRSLRAGDYRVLYVIIARRILIQVVSIGHRRDIYK